MHAFQLEMREIHKTTDFHSNLLVSWEFVTNGYQGRPEMHVFQKTLTRHGNSLVFLNIGKIAGCRALLCTTVLHLC